MDTSYFARDNSDDEEDVYKKNKILKPKNMENDDEDEEGDVIESDEESEEGDDDEEENDDEYIGTKIQRGGVDDLGKDDDDNLVEDDDEDADEEDDEEEDETNATSSKKTKVIKPIPFNILNNEEDEDDESDEDGGEYLKKFDKDIQQNYIMIFHPECVHHNYDEIEALTAVVRDKDGIIIDELHKTIPYLTKYEKTRILGQRAKQIDAGATPFVKVPENVIEGYLIATLELEQKRIPFIIRRPLPNGGSEYWNVKDLENISY